MSALTLTKLLDDATNQDIRQLHEYYYHAKESFDFNDCKESKELDIIFHYALFNPELFPAIKLKKEHQSLHMYIAHWVKQYVDEFRNPPSERIATPKRSCSDPVIKYIVRETMDLSNEEADKQETAHNLFMSAENIQGNLLEEYIAMRVKDYGIIWCRGKVLKSIDFFSPTTNLLLQVKNKSNTENSSSNKVRQDTNIQKWYRLGTTKKNGAQIPKYCWDKLNKIINKSCSDNLYQCNMSEDDYKSFIYNVIKNNKRLITSK